MKQLFYISLLAAFCFILSTGFQCGSPELTSAKLYIQQKNNDKALEAAEKEVAKNPKSVEGWYLVGQLKGDKKDYQGMIDAFNTCLSLDPVTHKNEINDRKRNYWIMAFNSGVSNYNKAKKDESKEMYDKAIKDFSDATIIQPDSLGSYWNLAATYVNKGDQEGAVRVYSKIAEKSNDVLAYIKIGDSYIQKGNNHKTEFDAANKEKVELLFHFQSIEKKVSKETVRKHLGEPDEIIKPQPPKKGKKTKDTKDAKEPDQREEWVYKKYNLHIFFEKDGELVAEKKFIPAYEVKIDSTEYFNAVKEWDNAIVWYTKAKDNAPDSMKIQIQEQLTMLYTSTNRLDVAIKSYEELVVKDPSNKNYHFVLGVLYQNNKKFDDAIKQFKKVIDIDPNDEKSYYNVFVVFNNWAIKTRDEANAAGKDDTTYIQILKQGLPFIQKLNEFKPDNLDYIEPLRSLYGIFQMKPDLEKVLSRLINLETKHGSNPFYWETIAKCYTSLNKVSEAMKCYDKADQLRKQK